jgi:hypothetical protein
VPEYVLEKVVNVLGEEHEFIKDYLIVWLLKNGTKVPVEVLPNHSKMDLVEEVGLKDVSGIDYALPQGVVDKVQKEMNFNIVPHFVMDCRGSYKLLPITSIGRAILPVIEKVIWK